MGRIARVLVDNAMYHVMVRGNQKQIVYFDDEDYGLYMRKLCLYNSDFDFRLYAYCLMPNHAHLVVHVARSRDLSRFMHRLSLSYSLYFNRKYGKVGHLWQGRFGSRVILNDKYATDCINYVETNPVRSNIVREPHEYKWSSYRERLLYQNAQVRGPMIDRLVL